MNIIHGVLRRSFQASEKAEKTISKGWNADDHIDIFVALVHFKEQSRWRWSCKAPQSQTNREIIRF